MRHHYTHILISTISALSHIIIFICTLFVAKLHSIITIVSTIQCVFCACEEIDGALSIQSNEFLLNVLLALIFLPHWFQCGVVTRRVHSLPWFLLEIVFIWMCYIPLGRGQGSGRYVYYYYHTHTIIGGV